MVGKSAGTGQIFRDYVLLATTRRPKKSMKNFLFSMITKQNDPPAYFSKRGSGAGVVFAKKASFRKFSSLHAVYETIVCIELKLTENRGLQFNDPFKKGVEKNGSILC